MKKLLWILVILLLLWLGFLYIVKNPELPISQNILTTLGIQTAVPQELTWETTTGIDLTNCTSYFDGCNNCSVKDGKPDACTLMYCETPAEPKCLQYATGAESSTGYEFTFGSLNNVTVKYDGNTKVLDRLTSQGSYSGRCDENQTLQQVQNDVNTLLAGFSSDDVVSYYTITDNNYPDFFGWDILQIQIVPNKFNMSLEDLQSFWERYSCGGVPDDLYAMNEKYVMIKALCGWNTQDDRWCHEIEANIQLK
jgi:hypothetical protein